MFTTDILIIDRSSSSYKLNNNTNIFNGIIPLSFAQKRLWFLDQFEPGSSVYNIPSAIVLDGIINNNDNDEYQQYQYQAIEESIAEIINRHEVLRTTFIHIK